jgi:hypothetical protein
VADAEAYVPCRRDEFITYGMDMADITLDFWRDDYAEAACVEYSYVPQGQRRTIQLNTGQQQAIQTDTLPDEVEPSHVQVYVLTNNDMVSVAMWQFPPGPPYGQPVTGAQVTIVQARMIAVGAVTYADGTVNTGSVPLDAGPRPCPSEAPRDQRTGE